MVAILISNSDFGTMTRKAAEAPYPVQEPVERIAPSITTGIFYTCPLVEACYCFASKLEPLESLGAMPRNA